MKKLFKEHDLVKMVLLLLGVIVLLSWILPTGAILESAGSFTEGEYFKGLGLLHIFYGFSSAIQSYYMPIAYLVFVGIFYGIVSKTETYKAFVSKVAKLAKNHEMIFAIAISLIVAVLASMLNNTVVLFLFMPVLISILRRIGLSKMNAFACTFGSILVGVLGATVGSEGLESFISYVSNGGAELTLTTEILVRVGILALAFVLFSFFNVTSIKKTLAEKKHEEIKDDIFYAEEPSKKAKAWPMAISFAVLLIFAILGFISWETAFGVELFQDFHTNIMEWVIGDFAIYEAILGNGVASQLGMALGNWYLFNYSIILVFVTIFVVIVSKTKWNDIFTNAWEGIKGLIKPIGLLVLAYMSLILLDFVSFLPTVMNEIAKISGGAFNPFVMSLQAIVVSIFNSDFAYIGYSFYSYLGSFAGTDGNIMLLIYTTMYGLVQFVTPISVALLFGLSYMNIPYKKWFQYIWKFLVGMLVCLLVIFALLAYL